MENTSETATTAGTSRVDTIASNLSIFYLLSHDFNFSKKFLNYFINLDSLLAYFGSCLNNHDSV